MAAITKHEGELYRLAQVMRFARRAPLLVAFLLLTSAAPAYAECAWVLWGELTGPPTYETSDFLVSAFDTKPACEQALSKQVAQATRRKAKDAEVTVDDVSGRPRIWHKMRAKDGSTLTTIYRYVCLPDTVDPRGPKGK